MQLSELRFNRFNTHSATSSPVSTDQAVTSFESMIPLRVLWLLCFLKMWDYTRRPVSSWTGNETRW